MILQHNDYFYYSDRRERAFASFGIVDDVSSEKTAASHTAIQSYSPRS